MDFQKFFNPKSVAVIGASTQPEKVGYAVMKNILGGAKREVYPVSISQTEVMGLPAYRSVTDVPGAVDLAVIAVKADLVPATLEACADKGIKNVVLISGGFKEEGEEGRKREAEAARIAKENGIALLGPNCLGLLDTWSDFNPSFAVQKPPKGSVAFLSQSGAMGTALFDWAIKEGVGISKFVSLGNEAVLDECDFLEHIANDTETGAVLVYLEHVKDGPRFMELARKVSERKPLVILRAGRGERGTAAVMSHTGSLAPSDAVFAAAAKQAGAMTVDSLRELFGLAKLFHMGVTSPLRKLAIVTNGGGPSVNTADLVDISKSLELVSFSEGTKDELKKALPPMAAVGNPIDVIGDAPAKRYDDTLRVLCGMQNIEAILLLVTPQMMTDAEGIARVALSYNDRKKTIPVFMGGPSVEKGVAALRAAAVPNFEFSSDAVQALDTLARGAAKAAPAKRAANEQDGEMMPFDDMQILLWQYDLGVDGIYMHHRNEINDTLWKLGEGPFALKAISKSVVHKTDMNAVALNLKDACDVLQAWDEMGNAIRTKVQGAVVDGVVVQKMRKGKECIIGMKRDPVFGPTILFGLGGIFVEILKDAALRVAPVGPEEALEQIREIKGFPLLAGARGEAPADIPGLAKMISLVSRLSLEHPEIEEIDLNPVMVSESGAIIVDARFMTK